MNQKITYEIRPVTRFKIIRTVTTEYEDGKGHADISIVAECETKGQADYLVDKLQDDALRDVDLVGEFKSNA